MESMVVYLGSDHVIKTPDFDFRKNSLRVSTTFEDAKNQAHEKVGIGVVSVYQLDLEHLSSIEDGQSVLDGFENVDVMKSRGASIYQSKGKANSDSSVSILWVKGISKKTSGLSLLVRKSIVPESNPPWQKRIGFSIFCLSLMIKFGQKVPAIGSGLRTTI